MQPLPPGTSVPGLGDKPADRSIAAVQAAEKLMEVQDWVKAATLLEGVVKREPRNVQALVDLGFCKDALNDFSGAQSAYGLALQTDPKNLPAAVNLGLLLARNDDPKGATTALRRAVDLPGEGGDATKVAELQTYRAQAYRALARLQLAADPEQSRNDLLQALRLTPEVPDDVQLAGEIAEALQDDAAAATAYARVDHAAPGDAQAALQYARVLARQGQTAEAARVIDAALAVHADDANLLVEKAALLLRGKDFGAAIPLLERLHATRPETATTRLLAEAYVAHGEPAKADTLFREVSQTEPNNGTVLAEWADNLMKQRRSTEAQTLLERALTLQFTVRQTARKPHRCWHSLLRRITSRRWLCVPSQFRTRRSR